MSLNQKLLQQLLPLPAKWPSAYLESTDGPGAYIQEKLSCRASLGAFREAFVEGGYGQGNFRSYSVFTYWRAGRNQFMQGGSSYVAAAFLYVSHMAPVACFGFGEAHWHRRSASGKDRATPRDWAFGEPLGLHSAAPQAWEARPGWEALQAQVEAVVSSASLSMLGIEQVNSPLSPDAASCFVYVDGLELPVPRRLKDLLFHEGVDWSY